jgi:hypothetical protein
MAADMQDSPVQVAACVFPRGWMALLVQESVAGGQAVHAALRIGGVCGGRQIWGERRHDETQHPLRPYQIAALDM